MVQLDGLPDSIAKLLSSLWAKASELLPPAPTDAAITASNVSVPSLENITDALTEDVVIFLTSSILYLYYSRRERILSAAGSALPSLRHQQAPAPPSLSSRSLPTSRSASMPTTMPTTAPSVITPHQTASQGVEGSRNDSPAKSKEGGLGHCDSKKNGALSSSTSSESISKEDGYSASSSSEAASAAAAQKGIAVNGERNGGESRPLISIGDDGKSLNADELICLVSGESNEPLPHGGKRYEMRKNNLWHRATYVLVRHEPAHIEQHGEHVSDVYVLVQKRSSRKDYCPGKFDPTPGGVVAFEESYLTNAVREIEEEMGIVVTKEQEGKDNNGGTGVNDHGDSKRKSKNTIKRLFTFPYEDENVRVWGDFYECTYTGTLKDLKLQETEVDDVLRMSLEELKDRIEQTPQDFMPDSCHAMYLYFQHHDDLRLERKHSLTDTDSYSLRPKPEAIFFDCDDCLYFDGWETAKMLTSKIDEWCVQHGLKTGQAYQLYKQYGTALRGLLAEGYLEETDEAIDGFLREVHDIPVSDLIPRNDALRDMLLEMDPSLPRYIFTASVADHAKRCLRALGIEDLFVDIIDCKKCGLETKHSHHSFEVAMRVAGVEDPRRCIFFDDSVSNIRAGRNMGWRCVLVGRIGRDHGNPISSEHAEVEIDNILDCPKVLPELFGNANANANGGGATTWRSTAVIMPGTDLN